MDALEPNAERFSGFADLYDTCRPAPPDDLARLLVGYAGGRVGHAVDLGCGTGLSTRWLAGLAGRVTGVEPSADMRAVAAAAGGGAISYQEGWSHASGLDDACADLVVAVQALHWMEPTSTLAEVARILRPGGIFAAIDCDWPPMVGHAGVEAAWDTCRRRMRVLEERVASGWEDAAVAEAPVRDDDPLAEGYDGSDAHRDRSLIGGVRSWSKSGHLDRMIASGHFEWCRDVVTHTTEPGDADRFVGLMRSQGDYQTLRRRGFDDDLIGLTELATVTRAGLGDGEVPFRFGYRSRIGMMPRG
ncbi:MAG: methyltransferase domain-containing protein [Actinomycetota bacterium]|nr:methyltransferase domain-containing protein [Actinomycetota bacterium]